MAAPFVTGIAALFAHDEGLRGGALKQRLLESAAGSGIARFLKKK